MKIHIRFLKNTKVDVGVHQNSKFHRNIIQYFNKNPHDLTAAYIIGMSNFYIGSYDKSIQHLNLANKNDLVLDPFLGSGTTALACKNTNRKLDRSNY